MDTGLLPVLAAVDSAVSVGAQVSLHDHIYFGYTRGRGIAVSYDSSVFDLLMSCTLFSTVAVGSQVPRTSLKTGCFQRASLFTSSDEWWGDCELCVEITFCSVSGLLPYDRLNDLF